MKGVLILAHGSRQKSTERTLEQVVDMVRQQLPRTLIELGYMEFSGKNIAAGLAALQRQGADEIVVAPYFLFDGIHIREDIPGEIAAFQQDHPGVRVCLGETLGADPRMAQILADRVRACL